jgi:TIR domain
VFVSHAGADTWVARQLARRIKSCGAWPFLDEAEIQSGQDFEKEILAFLDIADELVVLLTPWSLDRPYVWAELGAAWTRKIPIVILPHGLNAADLQAKPGAPIFLKSKNCRALNDADTYFRELRTRVRRRATRRRVLV